MKTILDLCKILVDAYLLYNLSCLANCDNFYSLKSEWSNMELIHVLHLHVTLFLLLIGYIYFSMYFLRDVSPMYTFPSTVLAPKTSLGFLNIISLCGSCNDIWSRLFCFFKRVMLILTDNASDTLGVVHTIGYFFIHVRHSLTGFSENILL